MESRQNKVLLPSTGPENIPAHQCNGPVHPNREGRTQCPFLIIEQSQQETTKKGNIFHV
jgi:hypothetical protein